MQELALTDCYGHAGLSPEAANITLRIEPFKTISSKVTNAQLLDAVRFYFDLPVTSDTSWLSAPIIDVDESFSMITNKRELSIISMALIAKEIGEKNQFAALAFMVASAFGLRKPVVHPQFVEDVDAAAKDLMTSRAALGDQKPIQARAINKEFHGSDEDNVSPFNAEALKAINVDNHEMVKNLALQVRAAIGPLRSEVENLREETDMLWWLTGGESYLTKQVFYTVDEHRAALLIGTDLASLSSTCLGPRASGFLMNKALREGRELSSKKIKISEIPKLFSIEELSILGRHGDIDKVRDLCFVNNALARAVDVGALTGWEMMYAKDNGLDDKSAFDATNLAIQSFRETLLIDAI
jgi:hypothetical protein